jgi:hypothetical protein
MLSLVATGYVSPKIMKKLWIVALLLAMLGSASAEQKYTNWCEKGAQSVVTQGVNSTSKVQGSQPSCLVTVYQHATTNLATLHSDNSGTPLGNPFTANTDGSYGFYTADGHYDIQTCTKSATTLTCVASTIFPTPFTISDVIFCDGCGGGGGGGSGTVTSIAATASNTGLAVTGSPITTSGTLAFTSTASAADQTIVSTAAATNVYKDLPGCLDTSGNHLNYDTSTHSFSCGNSSTGGTGTVTSVGLIATSTGFNVSGSPVSTAGSLTLISNASASDQALTSTAAGVNSYLPLPNCLDTTGQHLNYNTTTHTYSCGTSSSGGGGINFTFCGTWSSSVPYAQGCVVSFTGSSYAAVVANTGVSPDSGIATWQLLAQAGTNGTNGTSGTNGSNGAPGAPGYSPNQIISGCGVSYSGSGFTFTVAACTYLVNNVQYTAPQTTVTGTAADPTLPRFDSIVANSCSPLPCNGTITIVAGTASSTAAPPNLDITTQTQVTFYGIDAAATNPSNLATTDIYHNNAEWTCASTANFNCASTNNPHTGTLDIEATSAGTGNNVRLTIPSGTVNIGDYNVVNKYFRFKAAFPSTRSITAQWYNGSTAKCTPVTLRDGTFGINTALTTYQLVSIPTSVFACDGIPVTQLRFTVAGTGTSVGFYLDDITLEGGLISPVGSLGERWRGDWSNTAAYSVNDEVFYAITGSSYIALQSSTNVVPGSSSATWHVKDTHGPAGVAGNIQVNAGNGSFASIPNSYTVGSDVNFGTLVLKAYSFESTDTVNNSHWNFQTGSGGDSTCDTFLPLSGDATLCIKSGLVVEAKNGGLTYYPLATTTGSTTTNNCAKWDANGNLVDSGSPCGSGSGSVTSIATTSPITGGTITTTGTIACATCVVASSPGAGIARFAGSTQTVTSAELSGDATTSGSNAVTLASKYKTHICEIVVGDPGSASPALANDNDTPVVCGNITGADVTITAVACYADAGSPTVTPVLTGGGAIVTGAITCGTASWAAGTISGTPTIHSFSANGATCSSTPCTLDANITTAGGTAKYIVMHFTIAQ